MIKRLFGISLLFYGLLFSLHANAQINRIKVLSWNILNWPSTSNIASDTTTRCPAYRTVLSYAQPDIVMTCENNGFTGIPWFRDQVLNAISGSTWRYGTFVNGYDTDNAIYYRDSLFTFVSNVPVTTALRDISHFTLVYKPSGDTIHLFMCHLKAGLGFEPERGLEVTNLRAVTDAFPTGTNFLIGGDFNIYESAEPAYQNLIQVNATDGDFNDVITGMTGIWNNYSYRQYHTQSTRQTSGPGGGSTGGLDDRFDMLLMSSAIIQSGGVSYVPGTYTAIGNDGNHYNDEINFMPNTAVPSTVANALWTASDHLPVMATLQMSIPAGLADADAGAGNDFTVYPQPVQSTPGCFYTVTKAGEVTFSLMDITGRELWKQSEGVKSAGSYNEQLNDFPSLSAGVYLLSLKSANTLVVKKITVSN